MGWREASSVVLMALKDKPYSSLFNYKILMLKRSDKSSFMPNGYVFPGGAISTLDSSLKWLSLFKKFSTAFNCIVPQNNLPPMCQGETGDVLNKEISLRVTAIRETFEETGILLCRKDNTNSLWGQTLSSNQLSSWRKQVQEEPGKFLDMCATLECVPDIWALKLWSNWLTPPDFKKRFDTVFYTICLPQVPETIADGTEISDIVWYSPERLRSNALQGNLWLPPPQLYELSRIMRFCMLEDFASFANEREQQGCERYGTVRLKTKEGLIFSLPGDDTYGETNENRFISSTFKEARQNTNHVHRLEIYKNMKCEIVAENVKPRYGHLLPITDPLPKNVQCCRM